MDQIVIVGGGTAGWMAAIALSAQFPEKQITVIDPAEIRPIGVGESVTGVVLQFVLNPAHGLDLAEFFAHADATLKLGIWFKDWTAPGTEYLSPLDVPNRMFQHKYFQDSEDFYALMTAQGLSSGEEQIHGKLMRANRTDYVREPDGRISSKLSSASCHFDSLKFAAWLKSKAQTRPNITHVDDVLSRFSQDAETGLVTEVVTKKGQHIGGDFFLDCTGLRRMLFQPAYQPQWIDYSRYIKVDSAMPTFAAHAEGERMPVYTAARAMRHGWMWQIPTQSRLGNGYVYSSQYASDEQVIAEQQELGIDVGENPRILRFQPGKFATQMQGNVCAIGLSGGFIEPLEATTIHIMFVQIRILAELLLPYYSPQASDALSQKYNTLIATMYNDFVDFVSFHYRTGRMDSDFWRDYQRDDSHSPANNARLETWRHAFPSREDFASSPTNRVLLTTGLIVWMPMLSGLGLLSGEAARKLLASSRFGQHAQANMARYMQVRDFLLANGVPQEEVLGECFG